MLATCALLSVMLVSACGAPSPRATVGTDTARVRQELEQQYQRLASASLSHDLAGMLALRTADFHAITPEGRTQDYATMATYTEGILNGIKKWNRATFTIDSLRVSGDTAFATIAQHLDRMALRQDNAVHHVQTWVTQRETWIRSQGKWLMWRVDQVRNQRRIIDGQPG